MAYQPTKNQAYDHQIYLSRQLVQLANSTAGASGTFGRYVARGNEILYSAGAYQVTAGTSTYTTTDTLGGVVSTNTSIAATLITPFRVSGTSTTTGATFAISTSGTRQNNWTELTTATGGIALSAGDVVYMVNGTDATAVSAPQWEIGFAPLANVAA